MTEPFGPPARLARGVFRRLLAQLITYYVSSPQNGGYESLMDDASERCSDAQWGVIEHTLKQVDVWLKDINTLQLTAPRPVWDLEIEQFFMTGAHQAEHDAEHHIQTPCPHPEHTPAAHWWTRGYAYQMRLYRALIAEARLQTGSPLIGDA